MKTDHPLNRASVALIIGRRGSGKSELLRRAVRLRSRVVVLDVLHCEDLSGRADAFVEDEGDYLDALRLRADLATWRLVVRPDDPGAAGWVASDLMPGDSSVKGFSVSVNGVTLALDEIDLWAPNHAGINAAVRAAIQRGRHYKLDMLAATRRPAECHRDLSSQADLLVTFRQHEPRDIAYLDAIGGRAFGQIAQGLGRFQYACFDAISGRLSVYDGRDHNITER